MTKFFYKLCPFFSMLLAFNSFAEPMPVDVIVVGAGIAGISAAQKLQSQGFSVQIIEARDRIGGRIWTDYSQKKPFELGAGWIHGSIGNPLMKLTEAFKIPTKTYDYDNLVVYNSSGHALNETTIDYIDALSHQFEVYLTNRQNNDEQDISIKQAFEDFIEYKGLSTQDAQWLYYQLVASIQNEYAGDLSKLSLLEFDQDSNFSGDDLVFPEGYSKLLSHLAQTLNIKLNEVVQSVDYKQMPIVVKTNLSSYKCHYVLCTVPLGVLQKGSIQFNPELPESKKQAMSKLEMGTLNRVYLQFPYVFWNKNVDEINYLSKNFSWLAITNLYKVNENKALVAFISGNQAELMENKTDNSIVNDLMEHLKLIYGSDIPQPNDYKITRWFSDPFSYGSYSFIKVNGDGYAYNELAKPINHRLFFAGEATHAKFPATVHGAYLSGLRAAQQIQASEEK